MPDAGVDETRTVVLHDPVFVDLAAGKSLALEGSVGALATVPTCAPSKGQAEGAVT